MNSRAAQLVQRMIKKDRLCHSFILCGEPGAGKRTAAYFMAKQILCEKGSGVPCQVCRSCRLIEASAHPDVITLTPSGKSGGYRQDDLRPIVYDSYIAPNETPGSHASKLYIIPELDKSLPAAQSVLLKVLEEPSEGVVFIMTAVDRQGILPTLLSRSVVINLPLMSKSESIKTLCELGYPRDRAESAYSLVGGNIGSLLACLRGERDQSPLREVIDAVSRADEYRLNRLLFQASRDKEELLRLIRELKELIASSCEEKNGVEPSRFKEEAALLLSSRWLDPRLGSLTKIYSLLDEAEKSLLKNSNPALTAGWLSSVICCQ